MKPQPKYLTTEQWVEAAIKAIEKWSPEQKARARKILIRQVGGPHRIGGVANQVTRRLRDFLFAPNAVVQRATGTV